MGQVNSDKSIQPSGINRFLIICFFSKLYPVLLFLFGSISVSFFELISAIHSLSRCSYSQPILFLEVGITNYRAYKVTFQNTNTELKILYNIPDLHDELQEYRHEPVQTKVPSMDREVSASHFRKVTMH